MMRPKPRFIGSNVARMRWKADDRSIARIASHFAAGNSPIGATCWMPALLTTMSTWPKRADRALRHHVDGVAVRHVGAVIGDVDIVLLGERGALRFDLGRVAEAVQHDGGAALRQGAGDAEADAAGRAGHDGGPAFQRPACGQFASGFVTLSISVSVGWAASEQPVWGDSERGALNNEMPLCYGIDARIALVQNARRRATIAAMDIHHIRYFLAVCETRNFTRAAEKCNVTQPALSRAVQQLEDEVGGLLFRRERNLTHITDLGALLRPRFQQVSTS